MQRPMQCVWALLVAGLGALPGRPDTSTFAPPDPARPAFGEAPIVRTEHFVLEDEDGAFRGLAVWRRRESARTVQFERELAFRVEDAVGPDPVLFHVECLERSGSRLVLRETGARGRALLAELVDPAAPSLRAYEWGPCNSRQEVLRLERTAALPLYLAELARAGRLAVGPVGLFDPLERAVVDVAVTTGYAMDGTGRRTSSWRRADGTLVMELAFRGTDLVGFRLQDGGPWARRIDAETHGALRGSTVVAAAAKR